MLSPVYQEIRWCRFTHRPADAYNALRQTPPSSEEDAFEAVLCLLENQDHASALNVCRTADWRTPGLRDMTRALRVFIETGDAAQALPVAREAAPLPDAQALLLTWMQAAGRLDEAAQYVARHVGAVPPAELGLTRALLALARARGDHDAVYRHASAIQAAYPRDASALLALSSIAEMQENIHEALGLALRARVVAQRLSSDALKAACALMRCYNALGDFYAALGAFDTLGEPVPADGEMAAQRGIAHAGAGDHAQAIEWLNRAVNQAQPSMTALRALLNLYASVVDDPAAVADLSARAGAAVRGDVECLLALGLERQWHGDLDAAQRAFEDAYELGLAQQAALNALPWPVPEPRVRHEREQLECLLQRGKLDAAGQDALATLQRLHALPASVEQTYAPAGRDADRLELALTAPHFLPGKAFHGRALGDNDYAAIEDQYFAARPPLVVIDHFLSAQALAALRAYCEEATIWRMNNTRGYVGALLGAGFNPRVLLAIADELKRAMPRVIGGHALTQAWAFKYDQRMQGINMHADFAKVNVNFWVTPDAACADHTRGGMVVYDLPAPSGWTFADYNVNQPKMLAFLKANGATSQRVGYRENRCVLFDSSLIHITDELHFKPGYENRRVNVTLLYGRVRATD
jgi:tetratricopeptide (TPR) repeat protein